MSDDELFEHAAKNAATERANKDGSFFKIDFTMSSMK